MAATHAARRRYRAGLVEAVDRWSRILAHAYSRDDHVGAESALQQLAVAIRLGQGDLARAAQADDAR